MRVRFHKNFNKQYKKLTKQQQEKTRERLEVFLVNPFDQILNNHPLRGKYTDYRSINITGNIRAIYKFISEQECIFVAIDSHSNLYK